MGTSPKLRECTGGDPSAKKFEQCVRTVVGRAGAEIVDVKFEPNGRFARVLYYWDEPRAKSKVDHDLQSQQVVELVSADDLEGLRLGDEATSS
jgi:hypothetical protein